MRTILLIVLIVTLTFARSLEEPSMLLLFNDTTKATLDKDAKLLALNLHENTSAIDVWCYAYTVVDSSKI